MKQLLAAILITFAMASGCATAPPSGNGLTDAAVTKAQRTSFDIVYSLGGHGEHRLTGTFSAAEGAPHVAAYSEREVVDEAQINAGSYDHFLEKIVHFTQKPQRLPAQELDCRTPYWITLKIDEKSYTSKGCRASDDSGEFAKLVREGEFLLYSKK
jgi:hypothetical protein